MGNPFGHEEKGRIIRRFHKTDTSEEDRIFRERLPIFLKKVRNANDPGVFYSLHEKSVTQRVVPESVGKNMKENEKNSQDSMSSSVESDSVEVSYCENSTLSPRSRKVSHRDSPSNPTKPDFLDDLFAEAESAPDGSSPTSPTEKLDKESDDVSLEDESSGGSSGSLDKGFDYEGYKEVQAIVDRIMGQVDTDVNLPDLAANLDEYVVDLNLDSMREIKDVVGDLMIKVQAKMDSAGSILRKLIPYADACEKAWDTVEDIGMLCARGSNNEKRMAQLKFVARDLWLEYAEAARVRKSYENRLRELKGQLDTLSRLVTVDQHRNLYLKNVQRSDLPFDSQAYSAKTAVPDIVPEDEPCEKEETIFHQKKDEPLTPEKFADLDDMPQSPEKLANSPSPKKGSVNWGELEF